MKSMKKIAVLLILSLTLHFGFPMVRAEAPENIRYIAIGDSLTYGLGASEQNHLRINAFVPRFVKHLRTSRQVHVENYGIPGMTSAELNGLLNQDAGLRNTLSAANLITVTIGANDFIRVLRTMPNADEQMLITTMENLKAQIQLLNQTLRELNADADILYVGLYDPYPEGHENSDISRLFVPKYNAFLRTMEDENTKVADPSSSFAGKVNELTHLDQGDNHPNDNGYGVLARVIIEAFEQM